MICICLRYSYDSLKHYPIDTKANCYKSLVRTIIEYAAAVWAPYTQSSIDAIEAVLRRAAHFVYNNYSIYASVGNMIANSGWNTLCKRRHELRLIMLFKIVHNLIDIDAQSILVCRPPNHDTRGHHLRFFQVSYKVSQCTYRCWGIHVQFTIMEGEESKAPVIN